MWSIFLLLFLIFLIWFIPWLVWHLCWTPYPKTYTLYFGAPGCGKTTFLTRILKKYSNPKYGKVVYSNYPVNIPNVYKFEKKHMGHFEFGEHSLLVYDEASLDGFDNREFKSNFKDPDLLDFCKKIRHHQTSCCFGNQGFNELDIKIRTLTTQYWLVKKVLWFSIAIRVTKNTKDKDEDIVDCYQMPSFKSILFNPFSFQLIYRPKFYKYFDSFEKRKLDPMVRIPWFKG